MIEVGSFRAFLGKIICRIFTKNKVENIYFFDKRESSCKIKFILIYQGKVLLFKYLGDDMVSKYCLPFGNVCLDSFEDNAKSCEKILFDRLNLKVDEVFFDIKSLLTVEIEYNEEDSCLVYVYKYNLSEREFNSIKDSYIFYNALLFDLIDLDDYKDKNRFKFKFDIETLEKVKGEFLLNDKENG